MANPIGRRLDQEEEIIPAIRHEDAEWKIIQQNTFTRWVNNHLQKNGDKIQNLETDLSDGLKLISLASVLSQKNVGKFNKKVSFRSQKLENVSLALNFFQNEENIKIINIDSTHIVDHNKKLILGLIWTLILHYSISMGWIQEKREDGQPEETPKQKLLNWIRSRLPGVPVSNFTSDWNDGVALGALVNSMAPGVLSDWDQWSPNEALQNTQKAMKIAEDLLHVAPLIAPGELIHPEIDEMSVMTYLSQFPAAKPVIVQPSVNAYISNLDEFPIVAQPSEFDIRLSIDGYKPKFTLRDAEQNEVHTVVNKVSDDLFRVKYTPLRVGPLKIDVSAVNVHSFTSEPISDASRVVNVQPVVHLLDYPKKVRVGDNVKFNIVDAMDGNVEVIVVDANGQEQRLPIIESEKAGGYNFEYGVSNPGLHSLNVFHRKAHITGSPFPLRAIDKNDFVIWGRGTCSDGVRIGDPVTVCLHSKDPEEDISNANIDLHVASPDGSKLSTSVEYDDIERILSFTYTPIHAGEHEVTVRASSEPISSYKVNVSDKTNSKVRAFGPGLEAGIVNEASVFNVETSADADSLAFSIEGPSKAEIECHDRGNGAALVSYTPKQSGVYKVNVLAAGEHIQDSPFVLNVSEADANFKPSAARVTGLDEKKQHPVGEKARFRVDTRLVGADIVPKVVLYNSEMNEVSFGGREVTPGIFEYTFVPENPGKHHIDVSMRGVAAPGAPFVLNVSEPVNPSNLRIYGKGVEGPVYSQEPTHFTIDAKQAGTGAVEVALSDRSGEDVDIDVLDNSDGSFTVKYTAPRPGAYQLNVVFAGESMSPIEINVKPRVDLSGIRVEGLENGEKLIGSRLNVNVCTGDLVTQGNGIELIDEVDGKLYAVPLKKNSDGFYNKEFSLGIPGKNVFKLSFDGEPVKEAAVNVLNATDPSKAKLSGTNLKEGIVGEKNNFDIDIDGAGDGALHVEIKGPSKAESKVIDHGNARCTVEYLPTVPGDYNVSVRFGKEGGEKQHILGSPFATKVDYQKNSSLVDVLGLKNAVARAGQPFNFKIDASRTKSAPLSVQVPSLLECEQPVLKESLENARVYDVTFTPVGEPGSVISVDILYDKEPVSESPFSVRLFPEFEPENAKIKKANAKPILASNDAVFDLDLRSSGTVKEVTAKAEGPDGKIRKVIVKKSATDGVFELLVPTDIAGNYALKTYVNNQQLEPVIFEAKKNGEKGDVSIQEVLKERSLVLEQPVRIAYVHPEKANANFSFIAKNPDSVHCEVNRHMNQKTRVVTEEVVIRPTDVGPNSIDVYYGGEHIDHVEYETFTPEEFKTPSFAKASETTEDIVEKFETQFYNLPDVEEPHTRYRAESLVDSANNENDVSGHQKGLFTRDFRFNIGYDFDPAQLEAVIMPPSKKQEAAEIIDNHDGTIVVKYTPKTYGAHELSILQNGAQLQGTPIKFFVDSYGDGYATVYGTGLQNAIVGEPAAFTVCAKGSQAKELSVSIEGPAQSTIKIHDNKDGTCSVTWVPPVPGEYNVHVKLGGKAVRDSPFKVLVMGEGQKRAHLSVGSTSEVALNISQGELKGISASIKSPSGIEEPCFVRLIDGGRLGVSFTPREAGEHLITVKRDGKLLPKAPFKIKVDKAQVGDSNKVEISGEGKAKAISLQPNELLVDTTKAGYGGLSVSVQGPSKAELTCKEVKAGLIKVMYTPTEPGVYAIAVKFADHHVKDSPLTVQCTGKSAGRVLQSISRRVEQASLSLPDQESLLFLSLPNTSPMDINARIMDPKGHTEDVEMRDLGQQYYQIRFVPKSEGVHTLSVMHKDSHVVGSPFQFTVGTFSEGGAHKVRAAGQGVVRGETSNINSFNVYSREAGAGQLSVVVEGPSKAALEFKDHKDGNCHVEYKVATPGEYIIAVKFNDTHIPDSPFKVFIAPATGEVRKLELASFHDQGIPVGKAFTFTVLTHRAKGHLEAKVVSPNNEIETIDIVPIEDGESYALRFIPKDTGNHYIHVTLDGAPMRDSPFRLRVGGKDLSDPTAISASGEGLVKGMTGQKCEFVVTTANAGAGILQVQMDGPSKATLDAYELEKGYKVRYTPLAPGDYFASIKYNGIHIPGSPYKIPVEGKKLGGAGYNETSVVKVDAVAKTSKGTVAVAPEYHGDASKVTAKGAGLNKFFPGRPAAFQIDTGLAGTNLLLVGVVTTRGPCEEVVVKHQGQGHYVCTYRIQDRVKGFIFIKYGDQEIPGSPFAIEP